MTIEDLNVQKADCTRIIIVRHGESIGNATRRMLGHTDLDLSELGFKQAECTAEHLKGVKIDAIYSSDLMRAYNTGMPHARRRGLEIGREKGLRELYVGAWEGKPVEEILENCADMFKLQWHGGFGTFTFPDGEAVMDGARRFYNTVLKLAKRHIGQTIMICAHAAVIRGFWSIIAGIKPENIVAELPFSTNASYSVCEFDGNIVKPVEYSCDEHLSKIGITRVLS